MTDALTDDIREAFPDEREALRAVAMAVDILIRALKIGDESVKSFPPERPENPTRKQRKAWEKAYAEWLGRQQYPQPLGWKNELSVSALIELENKWLPLARERLGIIKEET